MRGTCERLDADRRADAWDIYRQKYPHMLEVADHVSAMDFYCLTPTNIRWIDNSVHFGFQVDFTWPLPDTPTHEDGRHGFV